VKETYHQSDFHTVCIRKNEKRGKPKQPPKLERIYSRNIPITTAKKDDLLALCNVGIIPAEFNFYENLKSNH